ncbi:MAG: DUF3102 domain-containing protein [Clostridia bacterium]|nr:DUF3102 domain-containing protein [Clostridia bacterium]
MAELAIKADRVPVLADYEARIQLYKEQVGMGYIGIGKTLLEAKAAKVVPHGEWEAWATSVTGLDLSAVQRCMKAAREIREGSALARLEMSKALMLLTSGLDEEEREAMARKAVEESATVRELRAEIDAKKAEIARMTQEREKIVELTKTKNQDLEKADRAICKKDATIRDLRQQLKEASRSNAYDSDQLDEALAAIEELRAELTAAEEREARKAEQLEALRKEQTQRAMEEARGLCTSSLSGFDLAAAVRAFIACAGVLPQMAGALASAGAAERETIRQNIETVARWVDGARAALDTVTVEGKDVEVASWRG